MRTGQELRMRTRSGDRMRSGRIIEEKLQSDIAVSRGAVNNTIIYTAVENYKLEPRSYGTGAQSVLA